MILQIAPSNVLKNTNILSTGWNEAAIFVLDVETVAIMTERFKLSEEMRLICQRLKDALSLPFIQWRFCAYCAERT